MGCQKDYYAILQILHNASDEEIRSAYKALAKKYHPDTNKNDPAANKRMAELNEAYKVLSTPPMKREYDLSRQENYEKTDPDTPSTQNAVSYQKAAVSRSKRKRINRILSRAAAIIILITVAAVIWLDIILPRQREAKEFESAMQLLDTGFYEEAYQKLETLRRHDIVEASRRDRAESDHETAESRQ